MYGQHHIIQKQIFDIEFCSDQRPFDLQNRISSLFYSRIEDIISTVLDQMIPEETLIKFDRLELNIEPIPYDRMESLLPDKLKEALEKELKDKLSLSVYHPDPAGNNNGLPNHKSLYLDLLAYFLITGTLPWWASGEIMTDPVKVIQILLEKNPSAVRQLIIKTGQLHYVRKRFAYQFPEKIIHDIINILEPGEAGFIFEYHREMIKIQRAEQPVKDETNEVAKAVWLFIFTYLLIDRGSNFNRKMFVKSTLIQMAEHYNLHYEEVLKMLAEPLINKTILAESYIPLSKIIKELFSEQVSYHSDDIFNITTENLIKQHPENASTKENLIRHYLNFGTLPPGANHHDAKQLNGILSELIQNSPETVRQLILDAENKETAIQYIISAFEIPVIDSIIKVVEPAQAEFIIHYMEYVQAAQFKKPVVSTDNKSFTLSVRQFVLTYLLIDRGSVFNDRMFLESNIRQMAHQYNLHYEKLLVFLIRSIGEEYQSTKEPLVLLLTGLLHTHKEPANGEDVLSEIKLQGRVKEISEHTIPGNKTISDILRFWIENGHFPWWAKDYTGKLPEAIWADTISKYPEEALSLIQYAGTGYAMKQRVAYQLPLGTIQAVFNLLPEGRKSVVLFKYLIYLLENMPELKIKNQPALQNTLILAWWDTFISAGYRTFDVNLFTSFSIIRLSKWIGIYPEIIRHSLSKIAGRSIGKIPVEELKSLPRSFTEALNIPLKTMEGWNGNDESPDIRSVISQYTAPENKNDEEFVLRASLRILEYYLTYARLPDEFPRWAQESLNTFLKNLLQLLIREKPVALRAVFQQDTHLPAARLRIHDLFSADTDGDNKNMQDFLHEFRLKDLLQYLNEIANLYSGIPDDKIFSGMLDKLIHHDLNGKEKELLRHLLSSPSIAQYIAEKYGDDVLFHLLENMISKNGKEAVTFLKEVQQIFSLAISDTLLKGKVFILFRQFNLQLLGGTNRIQTPSQYFNSFLPLLANSQSAEGLKIYQSLLKIISKEVVPSASVSEKLISTIQIQLKNLIKEKYPGTDMEETLMKAEVAQSQTLGQQNLQSPALKLRGPIREQQNEETTKEQIKKMLGLEEETIYIHNAGLVLLHPFLTTYFSRLALMEKGKFLQQESIFKGVHLLQFLIDGKQKHPEQDLALNKILCGLPVEEPVPTEVSFTQREKDVSMELLQVIAERWEKLKNTSVEGFRISFLQRDGALTKGEDSWKLRVDQRGYDVLLQTLPWSFGMIKTSWMEKILYVEWI
jgi:hypothetical protein